MLNRLKRRIPNPVKTKIRYAYYLLASPLERLSRDPLTPPRRLVFVGASDFRKIGHELFQCFVDPGGLQPDDSVLDVGCGIGRMAVPLTGYLSSASRYEGFDVVPVGIEWCRSHITPRFPNFRFQLADIRNKTYNPGGSYQADAYAFPYPADSFDFVIAISVFTHMLPADVKHYV
ncbi:MAG: class I SAM-dependent methyltransferase, partial [Gemmatimonadetes bacterium]|nr:class I SAM-dependent methyltransferase [Gemmatimonadota bacterium]